ncbi:YheC/YheD family protein [Paenibacillus thermoaerophilus]|uniref:YheC/YheD family protein n=1 Tax=Paenibacillus thermoaerophilus TaxID=1215385 RepID=A0ABW2V0Q1_9BACL|nr:YheC/YheD family protein [Paenibacillus thermoaerophilus]TMV16036.1 YheC/YheD family protein [Paenibacillus thermoaerophilus]
MTQETLGIMTLYIGAKGNLEERTYFRKMTVAGRKLGLDVAVFTPQDLSADGKQVYAHQYSPDAKTWTRRWIPLPHLIYDRCRYQESERFRQFREFRKKYAHLTFLNKPLANKWAMHQTLAKNEEIRKHLPETRIYRDSRDLLGLLSQQRLVYMKPVNGTGGRGILRIEKISGDQYLVEGRDRKRNILAPRRIRKDQLHVRLSAWGLRNRYLVQQGIRIELPDGRVHDFRLLIQKNGKGEWEVTGYAGRIGAKRSITSNLHGGGQAVAVDRLLKERFGEEKAESIQANMRSLGEKVAKYVESQYGQLCELGIDLAVDPKGHIWLIELNPKPGREVFSRLGDRQAYAKAIRQPLEYALFLARKKKNGTAD